MNPLLSVTVCVYNGADTLADCLRAFAQQNFPHDQFEVIVVDDGSTDDSVKIAERYKTRVERIPHRGLAAARNVAWQTARAPWVVFTDDDCGATRNWLQTLWRAVNQPSQERVLGAAGKMIGFPSDCDAARYAEIRGAFNNDTHLEHPRFPYAPMGNIIYRREALAAVNGLDERFTTYESCDLHTRLLRAYGGNFFYEPNALVLHRFYTTWEQYYRQQRWYGQGVAQFMWKYRGEIPWSLPRELGEWARVAALGHAPNPASDQRAALVRHGDFIKNLALRIGFAQTYWSQTERARW